MFLLYEIIVLCMTPLTSKYPCRTWENSFPPFIVWNIFPDERGYVLVFIMKHIFMFKLQRK